MDGENEIEYKKPKLKGLKPKKRESIKFDKKIKPDKLYNSKVKIKTTKGYVTIYTLWKRPKRYACYMEVLISLMNSIREQVAGKISKFRIISIEKEKLISEKTRTLSIEKSITFKELEGDFEITPGPQIIKNGDVFR